MQISARALSTHALLTVPAFLRAAVAAHALEAFAHHVVRLVALIVTPLAAIGELAPCAPALPALLLFTGRIGRSRLASGQGQQSDKDQKGSHHCNVQ